MNTDDNVTNKKITYVVPMNLCCKGSVMGGGVTPANAGVQL